MVECWQLIPNPWHGISLSHMAIVAPVVISYVAFTAPARGDVLDVARVDPGAVCVTAHYKIYLKLSQSISCDFSISHF